MEDNKFEEVYDVKEDLCEHEDTVFSVAKAEYKSLVEYLKTKVFPARVNYEHDEYQNVEFLAERGLVELDIILQFSLIELGYRKCNLSDEVVQTIEGVCEYGSLLTEIRKTEPYFDWTDFNAMGSLRSGNKIQNLNVYISKVSRDFAKFFVFVNPSPEDVMFRSVVQQKMNNIINVIDYQNKDLVGNEYRDPCLANAIFRQLVK